MTTQEQLEYDASQWRKWKHVLEKAMSETEDEKLERVARKLLEEWLSAPIPQMTKLSA